MMSWTCILDDDDNAYEILMGKLLGKWLHGRPKTYP